MKKYINKLLASLLIISIITLFVLSVIRIIPWIAFWIAAAIIWLLHLTTPKST